MTTHSIPDGIRPMPSRNEKDETVVRAHDLIYHYLEFQGLTPNRLDWSMSALADNPPRLIRYQRLVAILAAFGIKTDLASFDKGEFINENDPAYEPLLSRARKELPESLVSGMDRRGRDLRSQLGDLFRMLLEYRLKLEPALGFASGDLGGRWALHLRARESRGAESSDPTSSRNHRRPSRRAHQPDGCDRDGRRACQTPRLPTWGPVRN